MAQYTFDPNQYPTGSLPSGWTEYGFSGKATIQNDPPFGNYLLVNNQNTPAFDGMVAWTELGVIDSTQWPLEIVARVRWSNSDVSTPGPLYADPSTWNGYSAVFTDRNDLVRLNQADAASWVSVAESSVGSVVEGEVWWIKWRIESGGRHLIKAWKDGDAEPAGWHIDVIDTTYSSGYIGVEIQRFGQNHYFWLGVGTNGDPAPTSSQPASIDTSASLALSSPTTSGQADEPPNTSASLLLTSPQTSGQADDGIRDTSASLLLVSPQVAGQAEAIEAVSASLRLASPAIAGNVGTSTADTSALLLLTSPKTSGTANAIAEATAALQFSAPVVSASSAGGRDISAALALASLQTAGQAKAMAVSASLRLASPAIAGNVSGLAMSVALKLAAPQVSGRSQLHPVAGGQIVTGALSLAATVDPVDIAAGRTEVGALGLTASVTKPSSAQGSVKTGNLAFGAQIYHVAAVIEGGLQVGALSLSCSLMSLNRLASADVVVTDAVFAGISVDDALHVHAVFAD